MIAIEVNVFTLCKSSLSYSTFLTVIHLPLKRRDFRKSRLKIQFEYFFPKICLTLSHKSQYFLL
ncbi:hypothetical protein D1609_17660 [Leptospira borgpetersenii serovar Hardjo-bovis]|nr:hypothetical protein D1609_17660 [Leptospira borgpetersenii serovar Hardjo-bovis]